MGISTAAIENARFRADAADALRIVALEGLATLFHRRSGLTHIVDGLTPVLLAALADAALTIDQLIAHLSHAFDVEAEGDVHAVIAGRLMELEAAGLVWRA